MAALDPRFTRWLAWLAPFALLALVLGLQTDWGRALKRPPLADAPVVPAPVATVLLPDFRVEGGIASLKATVERPLFNATRRPAAAAIAEAPKPVIQRGQFVLAGTMVTDKVAIAYLREGGPTGKSRSVRVGESINGMKVAEVTPDRVRLALGDEFEDLDLKVAKGPKTTVAVAPPAAAAAPGAAPPPGGASATGAQPVRAPVAPRVRGAVPQAGAPGTDGAANLRAARRSAREAERASATAGGAAPDANANAAPSTWGDVYNRMQNRPSK